MTNTKANPKPLLTPAKVQDLKVEGAEEAVREGAKHTYQVDPDALTPAPVDPDAPTFVRGHYEVSRHEHLLTLAPAQLTDAVKPLTDDKVAGLLEVEKSGQNRDYVVQILEKRLGMKADDVTSAGPFYENVTTHTKHREAAPNPLKGGEYVAGA